MANIQNAMKIIDQLIEGFKELKTELSSGETAAVAAVASIKEGKIDPVPAPVALNEDDLDSFDALKKALQSGKWPEAVNPHLICDPSSHEDKMERGRGIIELMIEEDLKSLKLLDFGCGEGHCVSVSTDYGTSLSVGYDTKEYPTWGQYTAKPNMLFSTDLDTVRSKGPYDVIMLFDVIDHLTTGDPTSVLTACASLLSASGKIYMRTHPWVSRHGTHLYHSLNKAYVHLVFTQDELNKIVPNPEHVEPSIGVIAPINTYGKFIADAGLKVANKRDITEKIEPFFKIPKIAQRIITNTKMSFFPEYQMSLQFIDYVIVK